jgi:hypothetical protein
VRNAFEVSWPAVVANGMRPERSDEMTVLVLDAVPKYPVPETENSVDDPYVLRRR